SLNGVLGRLATFRTDVAPGPPLCTSKVKDTLVPAPRPVMLAVPVKIALSALTTAPVICPVTYITLTVNCALPGPVVASGARARHSNPPVTAPPCLSAWKAIVVRTGVKLGAPVPPCTMKNLGTKQQKEERMHTES